MTGGWGDQLSPRRASPLRCVTGDRSLKSDAPRQSTLSGGTTRRSGVCASNPLSEVYTACPLMRAEAKLMRSTFRRSRWLCSGVREPESTWSGGQEGARKCGSRRGVCLRAKTSGSRRRRRAFAVGESRVAFLAWRGGGLRARSGRVLPSRREPTGRPRTGFSGKAQHRNVKLRFADLEPIRVTVTHPTLVPS